MLQSRPRTVTVQVWSLAQTVQDYSYAPSVGAHAGSNGAPELVATSVPRRHSDIRVPDEAATSTRILGGRAS